MNQVDKLGVIFIYGFGNDSTCWNIFRNFLEQEPFYDKLKIEAFDYNTGIIIPFPFNYVLKKIIQLNNIICTTTKNIKSINFCAELLATDMFNKFYGIKNVLIVCHSMGGLIARKYLMDHITKHQTKYFNVKSLLMYATPNTGTDILKILKDRTRLGFIISKNKQLSDLSPDSLFLSDLNNDWFNYIELSKLNVYNAVAEDDNLVNSEAIESYWGRYEDGFRPVTQTNHHSIIRPVRNTDTSYIILKNEISKCLELMDRELDNSEEE